MRKLIPTLLLCLYVAACYQVTDYGPQPKMTLDAWRDRVVVYTHWVNDVKEILEACPELDPSKTKIFEGCAVSEMIAEDQWICNIYVQKPVDFNDEARLATLGHETFHCFGAVHERR